MNRYLLPLAFVATLFFAGQSAFAYDHGHGGYGGGHHHHHHYQSFRPGFSIGFGSGYGLGYGGFGGVGYGASPIYGGLGYGYTNFASPYGYGYPQSYFASPGYGQWGGFRGCR